MDMDIITLCLLLGVASGVLHPAQGCKILVNINIYINVLMFELHICRIRAHAGSEG